MSVLLKIARRYFFSKKKQNFINVISILSMVGVAIGTMALVIALSVFNGLEGLLRDMFGSYDPELKIEAVRGKTFEKDTALLAWIRSVEGVGLVTEIVEDKALLKYKDGQLYVHVKGVDRSFVKQNNILSTLIHGNFDLERHGMSFAVIGHGIQGQLSIALFDQFYPMQLWYPRKSKNIFLNPEKAFNIHNIAPTGVFAIEKYYDENYMFVPIAFARKLFQMEGQVTSLEIRCTKPSLVPEVQEVLKGKLGAGFKVRNSDEQHESLLKAVKLEKLFVFITFSFLLAVASINIFFSLYMLAIDKQKDISIMKALGIRKSQLTKIFLFEGVIVGATGAVIGLLAGLAICALQQNFGLVSMGMETSIVDAYPVKMRTGDFVLAGATILGITFVASFLPAARAARTDERRFLK